MLEKIALKALDEHLNAGRLDAEEYGQRVAQASVARTRDGLDELFVDLPAPHPFGAPKPPPSWDGPAARPGRRLPTMKRRGETLRSATSPVVA